VKKTGCVHVCQAGAGVYHGPDRIRHGHTASRLRSHYLQEGWALQILQQQEDTPVVLPASEDSNNIGMMEFAKNSQLPAKRSAGDAILCRGDGL
jgi:hypothetical protein